ncbi:pre-mRNA cleavage and polyadenylation factor (CPF) complex subunit [Coniosporium apollinis]|uniref:Polyadenylation factor subunit 2 n=1 Tax=Coniosporium apollinis TaxID=61459 RepID=A0ABQ9P043_9PEZI|nr:pre-mRNA cleavage and polyadenylation factor (CPF) complex subunit [Coniosporium apollinis]
MRPSGPVTDYSSTYVQWMRNRRPRYRGTPAGEFERPSPSYIVDMLPPAARLSNAADTIPVKHLHQSLNKQRHPIQVVRWTPEGRRVLTGATSGEFTLWNGTGFNFETISQAHDGAVRAAKYSHSDDWLISADQIGMVKYWQPNFNNVKEIQAHDLPVRDLAFAPTDSRFVSASDDGTLKIWDFAGGTAESTLRGHEWEVKAVDWHPHKGLLVSGSKDSKVKLWDPRTGRCLTTLYGHKNQIAKTLFEPTQGHLLATCARDHTPRIFDLRMMRDMLLLRGHEKDVTTLTWHPIHRNLLTTAGSDGSIMHYLLDEPNPPPGTSETLSPYDSSDLTNAPSQSIYPAHRIPYAHELQIYALDWHPVGHILASGSNDRITRFWTRARPGESAYVNDRFHIGQAAAEAQGTYDRREGRRQMREEEEMEAEDEAKGLVDQSMPSRTQATALPGLPGISLGRDGTSTGGVQMPGLGSAPQPPIPPPAVGFLPFDPSKMDLTQLAAMWGGKPPIPLLGPDGKPLPPPGFPPPGGFPLQPPPGGFQGLPLVPPPSVGAPLPGVAGASNGGGGVRRRAPLPSQQESLQEEMRRGKFRNAR